MQNLPTQVKWTNIEDFPQLHAQLTLKKDKRVARSSRRSSVSSVSSSALTNVGQSACTWILPLNQDVVCRERSFCKCKKCVSPTYLSERKWNNLRRYPCKNAAVLEKGTMVKVLHERAYGRQGAVLIYVVQVIYGFEEANPIKGWVFPKALGGLKTVRKALFQKQAVQNVSAAKRMTNRVVQEQVEKPKPAFFEEDCSRAVCHAVVPETKCPYDFSELVLCRMRLGSPWMPAEVLCANPLKINPRGWKEGCEWDERNLKKFPVSQFVAVRDLAVRTNENPKAFVKANVPKGTTIGVCEMKGFYARINEPVCGWVEMRTNTALYALEANYRLQKVLPTVFYGNLPNPVSKAAICRGIQYLGECFTPSRIQLLKQGNDVCAKVSVQTNAGACRLASLPIVVKGRTVKGSLCIDYLRNKAALALNMKENAC